MKAKKIAAVCLSALMLFGNLASAGRFEARAEETAANEIVITEGTRIADNQLVYGDVTYEIVNGNHLEVVSGKAATGSVYIPLFISGLPVTAIRHNAFRGSAITSVRIERNVSFIGNIAFNLCKVGSVANRTSQIAVTGFLDLFTKYFNMRRNNIYTAVFFTFVRIIHSIITCTASYFQDARFFGYKRL